MRLPISALLWALAGLLHTVPADSRGDELIDRYLNLSARQDAVLYMMVDYKEGDQQPVHLEFTWMRKLKQGLAAHLLRMEAPASEKGKLLLIHEKSDGAAEYVAYRPNSALKKKVRISGARNYKYQGLSISVQELIGGELLKYTHEFKGTDNVMEIRCAVVENNLRKSFRSDSNFPRTLLYLREDTGMSLKWELFGKSSDLEKVIYVDEVKTIEGFLTITRARVEDLKKKGHLLLMLKEAHYHPDLKDSLFSEEFLRQNSR